MWCVRLRQAGGYLVNSIVRLLDGLGDREVRLREAGNGTGMGCRTLSGPGES